MEIIDNLFRYFWKNRIKWRNSTKDKIILKIIQKKKKILKRKRSSKKWNRNNRKTCKYSKFKKNLNKNKVVNLAVSSVIKASLRSIFYIYVMWVSQTEFPQICSRKINISSCSLLAVISFMNLVWATALKKTSNMELNITVFFVEQFQTWEFLCVLKERMKKCCKIFTMNFKQSSLFNQRSFRKSCRKYMKQKGLKNHKKVNNSTNSPKKIIQQKYLNQ